MPDMFMVQPTMRHVGTTTATKATTIASAISAFLWLAPSLIGPSLKATERG